MDFLHTHQNRDKNLPYQRQRLIDTIEQDVRNDNNILAVFYDGSIGSGETDDYSDIDLRIVVKDEAYEAYRSNKKERTKNWGNVLFFEDFPWSIYTVAHYDNFIKVDVFYYRIDDIQPSLWLQNIKVVFDKTGFLEDITKKSKKLSYHPSVNEIEMWRSKFFALIHEAYRRVNRNELYYALHCLDCLRLSMVTGWYMDKGIQPNTFGDWARLEGEKSRLDDRQLVLLDSWHSTREPENILNIIQMTIPEFKKVHKQLCKKAGLNEDIEWVEEIFEKVF